MTIQFEYSSYTFLNSHIKAVYHGLSRVPRGNNWNNLMLFLNSIMLFPNANREVLSGSRLRMRTAGRGVDYIDTNFAPPVVVLSNTVPKHARVPRLELRPAADYIDRNNTPPLVVLSNTVLKNSSLQKNEEDREDKMSSALKQSY